MSNPAIASTGTGAATPQGLAASRRAAHVDVDGLGARRVADRKLPQLLVAPADHARRRHLCRGNPGDLQSRRLALGASGSAQSAGRPRLARPCRKRDARGQEMRSAEGSGRIHARTSTNGKSKPSISIRERPRDEGRAPPLECEPKTRPDAHAHFLKTPHSPCRRRGRGWRLSLRTLPASQSGPPAQASRTADAAA